MSYLGDFKRISVDWFSASFVSATLDYMFGYITIDTPIISTLIALTQLTMSYLLTRDFINLFEPREQTYIRYADMIVAPIIWQMSPNAVGTLTSNYRTFHSYLYGASDNNNNNDGDSGSQPILK